MAGARSGFGHPECFGIVRKAAASVLVVGDSPFAGLVESVAPGDHDRDVAGEVFGDVCRPFGGLGFVEVDGDQGQVCGSAGVLVEHGAFGEAEGLGDGGGAGPDVQVGDGALADQFVEQ